MGAATLTLLAVVRATQDLALEAEQRILGAVVALGLVVAALATHPSAGGVLGALTIAAAVSLGSLAWGLRGALGPRGGARATGVMRAALPLGAMALATIAYYRAPTVALGGLGSDVETARFTVAVTIAFGLLAIPNAITTGLLPRLAGLSSTGERLAAARAPSAGRSC